VSITNLFGYATAFLKINPSSGANRPMQHILDELIG